MAKRKLEDIPIINEKISGGRYSKWRTFQKDYESIVEAFEDLCANSESTRDGMKRVSREYSNFLKEMGMPYTENVYFDKDNNWFPEKPIDNNFIDTSCYDLEDYIIKKMGRDRDSPEGLAARVISSAYLSLKNKGDTALEYAYKMGEAHTLFRVYSIYRKMVSSSRNRKSPEIWKKIAEYLINQYPETSKRKLIELVADEEYKSDDNTFDLSSSITIRFWKSDKRLFARVFEEISTIGESVEEKVDIYKIGCESFRTKYLSKVVKIKNARGFSN
jgi:hypothetical protein